MKRKNILFLALLAFTQLTFSSDLKADFQRVPPGKLGSSYKRALRAFELKNYERAIKILNSSIVSTSSSKYEVGESALLLARVYNDVNEYAKSLELYNSLQNEHNRGFTPNDICLYLDLLKRNGSISKGVEVVKYYHKNMRGNVRFNNLEKSLLEYYQYYGDQARNTGLLVSKFELGSIVDGSYVYGVAPYQGGIVFLANEVDKSRLKSLSTNSKLYRFTSTGEIVPFSELRTIFQAGPVSFYNKGNSVVFTLNKLRSHKIGDKPFGEINNLQLYVEHRKEGSEKWSRPVIISKKFCPNSNRYSFLHPSISEDGSKLYFASDMPGGYGGVDIYYVDFDKKRQVFGKPVNLGPKINTNGDELFPYVEGNSLHFSSNGHKGYGGQDIFVTNLKEPDATIFHFPYPINTHFDDSNPVYDVINKKYYFSSDRKNSEEDNLTNKCVYIVESPDPMMSIMDAFNKTVKAGPIGGSGVGSKVVEELVALPNEEIFKLVHFDFNKAVLKTEELGILDNIYQLWSLNKKAVIDLSGNTDTVGTELYNLELSKRRAEVVRDYLIAKGIPSASFYLQYNGDNNPLKRIQPGMTENEIEQISRENRRTVIIIK